MNISRGSLRQQFALKLPSGQLLRYLLVGAWNTVFGYATYAALTYILTGRMPYAYMAASVIGSIFTITVAYLGYKFVVFRTKGNYLREYLRCFAVYGSSILINLVLLPIIVAALNAIMPSALAPYVAGVVLTAGTVAFSFIAHKRYSFPA